ncbi:MAG: hypothetical protein JXR51_08730 [Bacteroidales bacterium]|nr:hypothetical protein [Bacteroidales bacterium]MBN2757248.1 hypothetical protein [Bacteroidales bacterium]
MKQSAADLILKNSNLLLVYRLIFSKINKTNLIGKSIFLIVISLFYTLNIFSQGEIDDEKKIFFRNEKTWGINVYTNGYGANYRFAKRINGFKKSLYEIDFNYLKHPKEIKISNNYYNVNRFVFGKINHAYELTASYGRQREIFTKMDKGGVSVRYFYNAGPSLIFLKPIYYEVAYENGVKDEKFDINTYQIILGKSSYFIGFDEMGFNAGAFARAGFSFEFSRKDNKITALEIGGTAKAFLKEVEIMATSNSQFFFSIFLSYRFGKVVRGARMKNVGEEAEEDIF